MRSSARTALLPESWQVELGMCVRTAYRYIDAASVALPVAQDDGTPARFHLVESAGEIGRRDLDRMPILKKSAVFGKPLRIGGECRLEVGL